MDFDTIWRILYDAIISNKKVSFEINMTDFDFLKKEKDFAMFVDIAIKVEEIFHIDAKKH